jgi:hypothetical protein
VLESVDSTDRADERRGNPMKVLVLGKGTEKSEAVEFGAPEEYAVKARPKKSRNQAP